MVDVASLPLHERFWRARPDSTVAPAEPGRKDEVGAALVELGAPPAAAGGADVSGRLEELYRLLADGVAP